MDLEELRKQARSLADRIKAAVKEDYPQLNGWRMPYPSHPVVRTDGKSFEVLDDVPGDDDWEWGDWDTFYPEREERALRRYLDCAVGVAASRISEAYGLGRGSEWVASHNLDTDADVEAIAGAQVVSSLSSVLRQR